MQFYRMKPASRLVLIICLTVIWPAGVNSDPSDGLVEAARTQIGKTVLYDPSYRALAYPNGDVAMERGVCTDVVIRALRTACAIDLQQLVHEDMRDNFFRYPQRWGLTRPDKNIDHRRVPNLQAYFRRQGWALTMSARGEDYLPGDIVTCTVPPRLPHIMIVSDKKNNRGHPLVIHNIGTGVKEEDLLFDYTITGHYRIGNTIHLPSGS